MPEETPARQMSFRWCAWPARLSLLLWCAVMDAALGASLGAPELESALGERLRVVLPITGLAKEPLTVDCIKLYASNTEPYDVSNLIRASLIQRGSGQAVVLTTAQSMHEVAVSFEAGIGCGIFFSRRYTLLLDLARDRAPASGAAATPVAPAAEAISAPSAASAAATAAIKPSWRLRPRGDGINAPVAAGLGQAAKTASVVRRLRPEDEPGVLPRSRTRKALAPPVRSMLKIDIGGIDEWLTDPSRSPLEQSTGMRISGSLGGNARPAAAASADVEFKQAHARFLAALRDKPDPVSQENELLARRLDAVAKDIASLRLELQASSVRAKELEATRVSWWWLLVAAVLSAAAAAGLMLALRNPPARQLILIDPDHKATRVRTPNARTAEPDGSAGVTAITGTIAISGGPQAADAHQPATEPSAATTADAASVPFDLPPAAKAPVPLVAATAAYTPVQAAEFDNPLKYSAPIAALRAAVNAPEDAVLRINPSPALTAQKPDKNSLTQQLAAVEELSDESWTSYRYSPDAGGAAASLGVQGVPGSGKPPVSLVPIPSSPDDDHATPFELNFDLDAEMEAYSKAATESQPAVPAFDFSAAAASATPQALATSGGIPAAPGEGVVEATTIQAGDLLNFDFDDSAANPDRTEVLPQGDASAALAYQANRPTSNQAVMMQVMMATASGVMEASQQKWDAAGAAEALKILIPYLQLAPPNTPPGPWVMLAHVLHSEDMRAEYETVEKTFLNRFGAALPLWEQAASLATEQLGMARAPGLEIVVASQRGTSVLIGRLAGLAYRIDAPVEVLFDLQFHRQVLQLAAECRLDDAQSVPDVDLSL